MATWAMPTLGDRVVRASDRSLQDWVEQTGTIPNELNDPLAVYENQVVLTGHLGDHSIEFDSDTHWAYQ
jgi:hypothetical protein